MSGSKSRWCRRARTAKGREKDGFLADFYSLYERRSRENIGELINMALDAIEKANEGKLGGLVRAIDFNSETNLGQTKDRNRRLKTLLEDFAKPGLDLGDTSEDILGDAYIFLIERFASDAGKKAGEFFTPRKVSEVVAKLANPKTSAAAPPGQSAGTSRSSSTTRSVPARAASRRPFASLTASGLRSWPSPAARGQLA